MDTSQQLLLNDSFSFGWLLNAKSSSSSSLAAALGDSHRSVDTQDGGGSFIELDPNFISLRWTANDLDYGLPRPQPIQDHAIRSSSVDGGVEAACSALDSAILTKSQSVNSNRYNQRGGASANSSPLLFHSAKSSPSSPLDSRLVSSCAKSPKKIICKYLCFVTPLYKIVKGLRVASSRSGSGGCRDSARSTPRTSNALSSIDWCRSDADISIYDAILHCKKSIGQDM
ncbi:putative membrane-associated kinase regulator 6 [Canna indica]|uniref:Membrane-associated kinase regulator 6 n=1 Tax=Canna indica TaxID=4628 RepID=A0AAQ3Q6W0_9LILI|nr:putative membrane-associated kinase regulator 6 [Canna indica]